MNYTHPHLPRIFRIPFGRWLVPILGMLVCILLLINTTKATAARFGVWMAIGHIVYFLYGFWHSRAHVLKDQNTDVCMDDIVPTEAYVIPYESKSDLIFESADKSMSEITV